MRPAFDLINEGQCDLLSVPTRPQNVSVTEVNDRSLTLSWQSPRQTNGILLQYHVYWTTQGEPVLKRRLPADESMEYTVTELGESQYVYRTK